MVQVNCMYMYTVKNAVQMYIDYINSTKCMYMYNVCVKGCPHYSFNAD